MSTNHLAESKTRYFCQTPGCGRELQRKTARSGRHAGMDYIRCDAPTHTSEFWRWFARGQGSTSSSAASTAVSAAAASTQSFCTDPTCIHKPNKLCSRQQCRTHCIGNGGCTCPGHSAVVSSPSTSTSAPSLVASSSASSLAGSTSTSSSLLAGSTSSSSLAGPAPFLKDIIDYFENRMQPSLSVTLRPDMLETKARKEHPHWFLSPSPSPPRAAPPAPSHTFVLVDFYAHGKPASLELVSASGSYWRRPGTRPYECYSLEYSRWMPVEARYSHYIANKTRLIIRSLGVVGSNEAEEIATARADADSRDTVFSSNRSLNPTVNPYAGYSSLTPKVVRDAPVSDPGAGSSKLNIVPAPAALTSKRPIIDLTLSDDDDIHPIKREPLTPPPKRRRLASLRSISSSPDFPVTVPTPWEF
ncbi:hypothetical protein R3P38DRAFT_3166078 [Favolaschia claudopus]|uniref:C2H2-type domain-containing protein n=1 Tax=Favolaschia claudopus TaxID=2862362 RepID=A0AAW0EHX2_9AGAR